MSDALCRGGQVKKTNSPRHKRHCGSRFASSDKIHSLQRETEAGAAAAQELAAVQAHQDMKEISLPANQAQLLC